MPVSVELPHAATATASITTATAATTDDLGRCFQLLPTPRIVTHGRRRRVSRRGRRAEYGRAAWLGSRARIVADGPCPCADVGLIGLGRMGLPICA